ncbi:MAG TPA: MerR family transcriptional regulator [Solirubrobacteraceae bacterium]|nr:MerR family transcriptional regulator [Solirubrobacteraceae bacterium]
MSEAQALRIGEFARRVGVAPATLRAWERRYGLLEPGRSSGGFRLYGAREAQRVAHMRLGLQRGMSAAEAARAALAAADAPAGAQQRTIDASSASLLDVAAARLLEAIRQYDELTAHAVLDDSLEAVGLELALGGLILPVLRTVGEEWARGSLEVSQEHFASNLIRGRLISLARMWVRGQGPVALLCCPPGERHDIGLLAFGLLLRAHGWRILFLGADTPLQALGGAVTAARPELTVISSVDPARLESQSEAVALIAERTRLALGGPGAQPRICAALGALRLPDDAVLAAREVASAWPRQRGQTGPSSERSGPARRRR